MAHVCLQADECRAFIKNGKLRFQARRLNENEEVVEQVTISFPKEMADCFTKVKDFDCDENLVTHIEVKNRINKLLS